MRAKGFRNNMWQQNDPFIGLVVLIGIILFCLAKCT